eukprot:Platyproteum_vivax@DN4633_c0_g1_i2.p1
MQRPWADELDDTSDKLDGLQVEMFGEATKLKRLARKIKSRFGGESVSTTRTSTYLQDVSLPSKPKLFSSASSNYEQIVQVDRIHRYNKELVVARLVLSQANNVATHILERLERGRLRVKEHPNADLQKSIKDLKQEMKNLEKEMKDLEPTNVPRLQISTGKDFIEKHMSTYGVLELSEQDVFDYPEQAMDKWYPNMKRLRQKVLKQGKQVEDQFMDWFWKIAAAEKLKFSLREEGTSYIKWKYGFHGFQQTEIYESFFSRGLYLISTFTIAPLDNPRIFYQRALAINTYTKREGSKTGYTPTFTSLNREDPRHLWVALNRLQRAQQDGMQLIEIDIDLFNDGASEGFKVYNYRSSKLIIEDTNKVFLFDKNNPLEVDLRYQYGPSSHKRTEFDQVFTVGLERRESSPHMVHVVIRAFVYVNRVSNSYQALWRVQLKCTDDSVATESYFDMITTRDTIPATKNYGFPTFELTNPEKQAGSLVYFRTQEPLEVQKCMDSRTFKNKVQNNWVKQFNSRHIALTSSQRQISSLPTDSLNNYFTNKYDGYNFRSEHTDVGGVYRREPARKSQPNLFSVDNF